MEACVQDGLRGSASHCVILLHLIIKRQIYIFLLKISFLSLVKYPALFKYYIFMLAL